MAKTDVKARLQKHLKNIRKLKKDIKNFEDRKFLVKAIARLKI
jgi:hypothetical protein